MCKGNDFSPNEQRFFPKCEAQASEKALFNINPTLSPLNPPCAAPRTRRRSLSLPPEFPLASPGVPSSFLRRSPHPSSSVPSRFPLNSPFFPVELPLLSRDFPSLPLRSILRPTAFHPASPLIQTSHHPNAIFRRNLRPYRRSLRLYRCSLRLYGRSLRLNFPPIQIERSPMLPQDLHLRSGTKNVPVRFFK